MNLKYVFASTTSLLSLVTFAATNPLGFSTYERDVKVTFASEADAKAAEMKICALPHGAKLAFTTRWDDCNPNGLAKRDMLNSIGFKGTFFMNFNTAFLEKEGRDLIRGGNALGNHSVSHPFLMKGSISKMFSEVILNRIEVERATDFPVVSFVAPYNWASEKKEKPFELVRILCDTGNYVSSDWPLADCPIGPDTWLVGWEFDANDKTPNEWVFNDRIKKSVDKALKGDYPKITFGMHAWCDAKGNEVQRKLLSKYGNNPEWFYGNDNEYGAHRYAGLHGKAVKKSVKGKEAVFTLTMFDPAQTGSDIPVSVRFSAAPASVKVDGKDIKSEQGTFAIPHGRSALVKADAAKKDGSFEKFPGLNISLEPDEFSGKLSIKVENGMSAAMDDVNFTVMPAAGWKARRIIRAKGTLEKGKALSESFELGGRFDDPERWDGDSLYVVAIDFHQDGKAYRAWATKKVGNPFVPAPTNHVRAKTVPKDAVVKQGAETKVSLAGTWKVSVPQCSEKPWDETPIDAVTKWVDKPVPQNWNKAFLWEAYKKDKPYVMEWYTRDFEVGPEAKGRRTYISFESAAWNTIVFVNGKEVGRHLADYCPFEIEITSALKSGVNKLAINCRWDLAKYGNPAIPITHPSGNQWWYQNIHGGLWAPLFLVHREQVAITRLLATPLFDERAVEFDYVIDNPSAKDVKASAAIEVVSAMESSAGKKYGNEKVSLTLKPGANQGRIRVALPKDVPVWDVGKPELLWGVLKLDSGAAEAVRFGMREFKVKNGRFYMNGRPFFVFGQAASSQDFVPVDKSYEDIEKKAEKDILAFLDNGCTFVRTVHEPILKGFLDVADECGLPIFHEWAWGFSSRVDMTTFRPSSFQGVEEFVYGSYSHPSVIAWSMCNEVNVWEKEEVWKLADELVDFVHKLDRQGRPVSSGSGAGAGFAGKIPLKTDILDFHDYVGCSTPWAGVLNELERIYAMNESKYGAAAMKKMPIIGMEMLGFSWLNGNDPDYKPGDRQIYQKFLDRRVDWGGGKGAGLLGAMPMETVVKKQSEFYDIACNRYGRRLFEEMRLHPLSHGFAPWGAIPTQSTVWTQPLFPALRNSYKLNPRNLFAGETSEWTAYVHNGGKEIAKDLVMEISLNGDVLAKVKMPEVGTDDQVSAPVKFSVPKAVRGERVLGLRLLQNGKTVGLNSYEVFFADRAEENASVKAARPVAVLDCGNAANVTRAVKLFKNFGINADVVKSAGQAKDGSLLVLAPDYDGPQKFFGAKQEVTDFVSLRRGTLLILEQHGTESALPASQQLFKGNANFTDLVLPSHPAFAGLTWRQFDTWNNPDFGRVAIRFLSPFRWENSLAVKGPQLSTGNEFGSVLFEGTSGEGRIIISLFEAIKCAPEDSAAAKYLRNLIAYAAGADYSKDAKPVSGGKPLFAGKAEDVVTFDLRKFANAGFADKTPADDKQGGWLDQGDNDFRNVAAGKRLLRGVPFDVIDPDQNGDRSIIRVAGKQRPYFPQSVTGIKLGGKYDRLFFLHTAGYAHEGTSSNCGAYRMHYADGSTADFKIDSGANIADWWAARDCPKAPIGLLVRSGKGANVAAYIASWDNPNPDKEIVSFDFLSAAALRAGQNAWEVTSDPVPVLIAVSGLKAGAMPKGGADEYDLSGKEWKRQSAFVSNYQNLKVKDIVENGRHGMEIPFPAWTSGKDKDPFVMLWHNCPTGRKFTELVFQAKCDDNVSLKFVIPQKGWKFQLARYGKISGGGDWQEVRVNLTGKSWNGKEIDWSDLMEELFIYYAESDKKGVAYPAAKISIKDIRMIGPAPAGASVGGGEFDLSGKEWNRQSGFVTGYPNQKVKDIVENGRHGMEIPFPAWTDGKDKCPFVMLWHKLPKGRKFKELVFQAKSDDNTTLQFVIPQKGWKFQLARYAKISGGGDWQEVRVNLTGKSWDGRVINWDDLIEELFIHYCAPDMKGKSYPAAKISIKDLRLIDAD